MALPPTDESVGSRATISMETSSAHPSMLSPSAPCASLLSADGASSATMELSAVKSMSKTSFC